jgi:hypothetical protein
MLKKVKLGKHLNIILSEMCKKVGTDLDKVNIMQDEWQETHQWTIEQEQEFQDWLYKYLVANTDALLEITTYKPKELILATELMNLVKEFTLFYGWALTEEYDLADIQENKLNT